MRDLKWNNLRIGLLVILVAAVFAPIMVHAQDYTVGVKAGDWIKYGQITVIWTGNETEPSYVTDAKKMDWLRLDVLNVTGTTANLNWTVHFNNGTQTYRGDEVNIRSAFIAILIASNLTAGDQLSQMPGYTINQTVSRFFAGENRNVNIIDTKSSIEGYQSETKMYYDKNTGIMVEQYTNQTTPTNPGGYLEESLKATETNMWSANALDIIQNNLLYIIAGIAAIIVIVAATIVLRRRKPPPSQQPPRPSTPPPPS